MLFYTTYKKPIVVSSQWSNTAILFQRIITGIPRVGSQGRERVVGRSSSNAEVCVHGVLSNPREGSEVDAQDPLSGRWQLSEERVACIHASGHVQSIVEYLVVKTYATTYWT